MSLALVCRLPKKLAIPLSMEDEIVAQHANFMPPPSAPSNPDHVLHPGFGLIERDDLISVLNNLEILLELP
jgi:hypothetical protein